MKNKKTSTIETYEEIAEEYAEKWMGYLLIMKKDLDFFIEHLKGKRILDVGCGPGRDAKYFSDKGLDVTGIDLTEKFLKMASGYCKKSKFKKMDMRDLEFPDNFFHGLWACASFIHMKKKHAKKTLQGFFRVLKPGGILYMSVKKGKGEKQVSKPYYKTEKKRFMSFYEKEEIKKLVEDSGFKTIKISENKGESSHWIVVFAVKAGTHE